MAQEISSSAFPTDLTIRLHHTKSSFTATFKTRLSPGNIHKTKCSCSRLSKVWIGSDRLEGASSRNFLLPETPHKTTVLRFIFRSAAHTEKATAICSSSQSSCNSEDFRSHMIKMLKELAAICEAEHLSRQSKPRRTLKSLLRPFRTSNLDRKAVSEEVRAKMLSPLTPSALQGQGLGHIDILRSQMDLSTASVLKIGFSKYHPEHRAHELASCIPVTEVVAHTPLLPHAMRIEAQIHAELAAKRKVLACGQCGQDHREWFEISHAESREVVISWSKWASTSWKKSNQELKDRPVESHSRIQLHNRKNGPRSGSISRKVRQSGGWICSDRWAFSRLR